MDHNHDHSTNTHSLKCPVEGCPANIEVHAHSDEEAVNAIMMAGKAHFEEMHIDEKGMDLDQMVTFTKKNMKTL